MKKIIKIYNKILLFIKRRQILFVSFAMIGSVIYSLINKNNNPLLIKSALSLIAAAAVRGAVQGGIQGAQNVQEGQSTAGAVLSGATKGAAKNAISAGVGNAANTAKAAGAAKTKQTLDAKKATDAGKSAQNMNIPKKPKNVPTNPSMENGGADKLQSKPENMDSGTTKEAQKNSAVSEVDKEKASAKKERMLPSVDTNDNETGGSDLDEATDEIVKKAQNKNPIIFGIGMIIFFIFLIPVLFSQFESYSTKTISNFGCDKTNPTALCTTGNGIKNFFEKAKNLIKGYFVTDDELLSAKAEDIYEKYYNEYKVKIDIPTLLSTVLADGIKYSDDLDETEERILNREIVNRFNYLDEIARLQFDIYETQYECVLVDDKPSMRAISKTKTENGETKNQLPCGTTNVGEIVYRYDYQLDLTNYYEKLYNYKDVLAKIYGNDLVEAEGDMDLLISQIKSQKDMFVALYGGIEDDVCASPGNIPSELVYDTSINLKTPIKGTYNISSYFGIREGEYNNHAGIDVYGDTTIYAAGDGVVTRANTEKLGGNVIEITHTSSDGRKFVSQYGHLKTMLVSVGDTVIGGETIIGIMGATGDAANGVHLHFQFEEILSGIDIEYYNPLTIFVGADNYSYQCVGSKVTSDTCVSTGGSIAYISDKNDYDYNLIRAIFRVKGIDEISEVKNEIEFGDEFYSYIRGIYSTGTTEQKMILADIDLNNKKIRIDGVWYSYDGQEVSDYVLRSDFIVKYGTVDENIYKYINMGVGSISGSQYSCLGYSSSKAMYLDWNESHHSQVVDMISYLSNCLGLKEDLKSDGNIPEAVLQEKALRISSVYFGDSSPYQTNLYARAIVNTYLDLKEKGESLESLLYDCTTINAVDYVDVKQAGRCEMYEDYFECMENVNTYDNNQYWGRFIKQAGTSLARVRLLTIAYNFWGYVRYCGGGNTISTGQVCNNATYNSKEALIPEYSELVGSQYGDVLEGLDCGGFITKVFVTYIRKSSSVGDDYKLPYSLNEGGMCRTDTDYTTVTNFPNEDIVSYYANTKNKIKPGDVICDISKEFSGGEYVRGTRHTQMYVGFDDDDNDGFLDPDEPMYFIHTGEMDLGVVIKKVTLNTVNDKYHTYGTVFTINDKVK